MIPNASPMLDISVAGVTDFVKDPLYQGEVTFGLDPRVPLQARINGCQLFSSEGLKSAIPLNRVHYYQLTLCLAGRTTATLGLNSYELHRNMVYFSFPGQTNQFPRLDPALNTLSIAFTQDFLLDRGAAADDALQVSVFAVRRRARLRANRGAGRGPWPPSCTGSTKCTPATTPCARKYCASE